MDEEEREPMKKVNRGVLIKPETVDEYKAPAPFQRFMKVLIDEETVPGTPFSIAFSRYPAGARCPLHSHRDSSEVYFVLSGELIATVHGKKHKVKKGELIYIAPSIEHRAENRGIRTCRFMAINAPLGEDVTESKVKQTWNKVRPRFIRRSET